MDSSVFWYMDGDDLMGTTLLGAPVKAIATGLSGTINIVHLGNCFILTEENYPDQTIINYYLVK